MVFFLTFFNNNCYARYKDLYNACMGFGGSIGDINCIVCADFTTLPQQRWDVLRFSIASACLVYMKVYDAVEEIQDENKNKVDEDEWMRLQISEGEWLGQPVLVGGEAIECPPLLTAEEVKVLKAFPGSKSLLLQTWAMRAGGEGYAKLGIEPRMSAAMAGLGASILKLKSCGGTIVNTLALPIPFPYWHMLIMIMIVNYTLYTLAFLNYDSYLTPVIMFFVVLLLSSFREVSVELVNPFGHDEVDFPVSKYITDLRAGAVPLAVNTVWAPSMDEVVPAQKLVLPMSPAASAAWEAQVDDESAVTDTPV